MFTQRKDHLFLVDKIRAHNKFHIAGGVDVTMSPHTYRKVNSIVLGEAEPVMARLVAISGIKAGYRKEFWWTLFAGLLRNPRGFSSLALVTVSSAAEVGI